MSELLEQAIVDAEALKEAALKNAEQAVIEKYSTEVKNTVNMLLEQPMPEAPGTEEMVPMPPPDLGGMGMDMMGMDMGMGGPEEDAFPEVPMAHGDGEDLCPCPEEEETMVVDLDAIGAMLAKDEGEMPLPHEAIADELLAEEVDVNEDTLQSMLEKLTVDIRPNNCAPLGGNSALSEEYMEETLALANDTEVKEENENLEELMKEYYEANLGLAESNELLRESNQELTENNKEIIESNTSLKEENDKVKSILVHMKEKLDEVNLSNAKLLYTNRVLGSNSLNERQKINIVEALSKADSIEGAKVLYETLQSTVGERKQSAPKSLSEAVNRNPSTTLPRRSDVKPVDPIQDRWKKLAGLNN